MSNPLFQAMNGGMIPAQMGGMAKGSMGGSMMQFMQNLSQLRQSFKGDPREEVQKMLQSGQVTQQQVDWARQMAEQKIAQANQMGIQLMQMGLFR